ncbi:MAG: hypothetical protein HC822_25485 [Oscillochloris sp.]|nr:hypothetical protein [Oscillochloris sp.]
MGRRRSSATPSWFPTSLYRSLPRLWAGLVAQVQHNLRTGGRGLVFFAIGAVMLAMIGLLVANFVDQLMLSVRLDEQIVTMEQTVTALATDLNTLRDAVAYAESDVNVERIAREQLGYARDGDVVLLPQLPTPTLPPLQPPAAAAPAAPPQPDNWQRWWQALFPS